MHFYTNIIHRYHRRRRRISWPQDRSIVLILLLKLCLFLVCLAVPGSAFHVPTTRYGNLFLEFSSFGGLALAICITVESDDARVVRDDTSYLLLMRVLLF